MMPFLETLPWQDGSSVAMLNRRLEAEIPFQWHHHPEYELTLTLNSRGERYIGDHVAQYDECDLVLVGPSLPHTWVSREAIDPKLPHVALVIWFSPSWAQKICDDFVEFEALGDLLAGAGRGLAFPVEIALTLRSEFERFFELPPAERLLLLMTMLDRLGHVSGAKPLASSPVAGIGARESRKRIDRVLSHIHGNYAAGVSMAELADVAALSVSGLHRLFHRHMQGSVSHYVMQMRIGDACARLTASDQQISYIADLVGYRTVANFNRQFRALKGMTPRQYRTKFRR